MITEKREIEYIVWEHINDVFDGWNKLNQSFDGETQNGATFTNDIGMDSLDVLELHMDMEKEFQISIPDEIVEETNTVQKLIDAVYEIKNKS